MRLKLHSWIRVTLTVGLLGLATMGHAFSMSGGSYTNDWNGCDSGGDSRTGGVYVLRDSAGQAGPGGSSGGALTNWAGFIQVFGSPSPTVTATATPTASPSATPTPSVTLTASPTNVVAAPTPCGSVPYVHTFAGNGSGGYNSDSISATAASLYNPTGVAVDAAGNVYIADMHNNRIRKVSPSGIITTLAGTGTAGNTGDGGPATAATMNTPYDVAVDGAGNVYFTDANNNRIRMINTAGIISNFAGSSAGTAGNTGDGGAATSALLNKPSGLAFDPSGNLYVVDINNSRVRKISGGIITNFAGSPAGTGGDSGDGGAATSALLQWPYEIVFDPAGNAYISDYQNNRIRMVNPAGTITNFAGSPTGSAGYSGDGGLATAALLKNPVGVAVDAYGDVFIADGNNNAIRMVGPGGTIVTVAGNGTASYGGDGGPAAQSLFNSVWGLAFDGSGNLYVCDWNNSRIRVIGCPSGPTPTSTPTATPTASPSPTASPTASPTPTDTPTDSPTPTATLTATATATPSATVSDTFTDTPSATPTVSQSWTETYSLTPTPTWTPTVSQSWTETYSLTPTPTWTPTVSQSWTQTYSLTPTPTWTPTVSQSWTQTYSLTPTPTWTPTVSQSWTETYSLTPTPTWTPTVSQSWTQTYSLTPTPTWTPTVSQSWTQTYSLTPTPTWTPTVSQSWTQTYSLTPTPTWTPTVSQSWTQTYSLTPTPTWTPTVSQSWTETYSLTPTPTWTPTVSQSWTQTYSLTPTPTWTPTVSQSWTQTYSLTPTPTWTPTVSQSWTQTYSLTPTPTWTPTVSQSWTETYSLTPTPTWTPTVSQSWTATYSLTPTPTWTPTVSQSWTQTYSLTPTPTWTPTVSQSWTETFSLTPTPTWTPTVSQSWTETYSLTPTPTWTPTVSQSWTPSFTPTDTVTLTDSLTPSITQTFTSTDTVTPTDSPTSTDTAVGSPTDSPSPSATVTPTESPSATASATPSPSQTVTPLPTGTATATPTVTPEAATLTGSYQAGSGTYDFTGSGTPGGLVSIVDVSSSSTLGTGTVGATGGFSLLLGGTLTAGDQLQARAGGPTGPSTGAVTVSAAPLGTAGVAPTVPLDVGASVVTVGGVPGQGVTVIDPSTGQILGSGVIPAGGVGVVQLQSPLGASQAVQVLLGGQPGASLSSGNTPGTAPQWISGTALTEGSVVYATAAPGAVLQVVDGQGRILGSAVADAAGNAAVPVSGGSPGSPVWLVANGVKTPLGSATMALEGQQAILDKNLFRPSQGPLTVDFKATWAEPVTVKVYDLTGELIQELAQWETTAGALYQARWDGRNRDGEAVANGLYFVSIHGNSTHILKKVVVLR